MKTTAVPAYVSRWTMRGWLCGRSGNDTHISFKIYEDYIDREYRTLKKCRPGCTGAALLRGKLGWSAVHLLIKNHC
ncbi:MAG: hypothetical protein VB071_12585, partial [Lawsonibacter sp.]|nr:hypothetical protein [Lawsonibacter sp.]